MLIDAPGIDDKPKSVSVKDISSTDMKDFVNSVNRLER